MKRIILALSIFGWAITGIQAQDMKEMPKVSQEMPKGGDVAQKVKQSIESIDKACGGLTEDQKTKIMAINTEKFTKIAEVRTKMKGADKATLKKEIEAIRNTYKGSIRGILTPDQIAKFKESAKSHKKKGDKGEGKKHKKEGQGKKGKSEKGEKNDESMEKDALDDLDSDDLEK
jgi:hypothetical protein